MCKASFAYGINNDLSANNSGIAMGLGADLNLNAESSYAFGENITINNGDAVGIGYGHVIDGTASIAIGDLVDLNNPENYGLGQGIDVSNDRAMAIGFGSSSTNRLQDVGQNSITLGVAANNVFNIALNGSGNPVTGIGTGTSTPGSKLQIVGNGTSSSTSALDVQDNNNNSLLFVRDDGNVGIGTSNPSRKLVVDGAIFPSSGNSGSFKIGNTNNRWQEIWLSNGVHNGSDRRLKEEIDSLNYGMKEIMKLNPVSYRMKNLENEDKNLGLIAQDLEKVINEPVETGEGERKLKGVRYSGLIPVLINGMQEQQKQVQKQQQQIQELQANLENEKAEKVALKEQVNQLNEKVSQLAEQVNGVSESFNKADEESLNQKTATLSNEDADQAMLLQNRPNPYSNETVIPYYLPENAQNANMLITNSQGQMLKRIPLEGTGKGELTLQTTDLNKGQYQYTLIIDGRQIQTRKMIVK